MISEADGFQRDAHFWIRTDLPLQTTFRCLSREEVDLQPLNRFVMERGWVQHETREAIVGLRTKAACPAVALTSAGNAASVQLSSQFVSLRTCRVAVVDSCGVEHAVEVVADSLYEAAALGLQALRRDAWTEPIGGSTLIQVEVRQLVTKHVVTLMQIQRWLNGATHSPNERVKKDRLRRLLVDC